MKLVGWHHMIDNSFTTTPEFTKVHNDITAAIAAIAWPPGAADFTLNPTRDGNGVKPIKNAFVEVLVARGWLPESRPRRLDAEYTFNDGVKFGAEWETGNISSSHRAINRMLLGAFEGELRGGILVVPSRATYRFLTDRVGNYQELVPYLPLWSSYGKVLPAKAYLGIVVFEHDALDESVPTITKGTDGRALI
ncbi:hypothetical protein MSM1_17735 [Mycobacterium sp. SM1]|uniref:hypothetical protein n=1 Tax=Mycobacterium sp. SM1 TaxID=2816243 RepID=UPI001BCDD93A|nr:hypothetical protein [Mycobacterium sp. SM1]MBS4730094.1 hypothetical protein [Mycobacterium sp. SM1]